MSDSASYGGNTASASASGSGGGGMGGGGVSVSAQADAGPGYANASASCSGAANCASSYSAHAEADDTASTAPTWEEPGGDWKAHGEGTCSGGGNGGCGAQAWAKAGPGGGGGATCTGDCANFTQSGSNTFTRTAPSLKAQAQAEAAQRKAAGGKLGPDGKPITIEDMGPNARGFEGTKNENGDPVLKVKPEGGDVRTEVCPDGCTDGATLRTESGETVHYDPKTGFDGSMPTEPGAEADDKATGSDGVSLYRDAEGDGAGTVSGKGSVTDGRTGETVTYTRSNPEGKGDNSYRLSTPKGSPFRSSCNGGCEYRGATATLAAPKAGRDHLSVEGPSGDIVGRDGAGNPAKITFQGKGRFTSAEGDVLTANGDGAGAPSGQLSMITTRGSNGEPGRYDVTGGQSGSLKLKEGYTLVQDGHSWVHRFSETDQLKAMKAGTSLPPDILLGGAWGIGATTPDGKGKGGTLDCEGHCTLTRPADQRQLPRYTEPVRLHEEMASGEGPTPNGAGSVENLGAGKLEYVDPYGNRGRCEGTSCHVGATFGPGGGTVCEGKGCRTRNVAGHSVEGQGYLLHPTEDGKQNIGFGCKTPGSCTSTGPITDLGWLGEPDATWMPGIDSDYRRPAQDTAVDRELAKHLGLKPGDPLPPLNSAALADLKENDPATYDKYVTSLPTLSRTQKDTAIIRVGGALSTLDQHSQEMGKKVPGLERALAAQKEANKGGLTAREERDLAPHLKVIDEAASVDPNVARARALVDGVRGQTPRPHITADQQTSIGTDPDIPGHEEGLAGMGLDEKGNPLTEMSSADKAKANAAQIASMTLIPRQEAVERRIADYQRRSTALERSGDATPADVAALEAERGGINGELDSIKGVQNRVEATGDHLRKLGVAGSYSPQQLRRIDIGAAEASGDHALAGTLRTWDALLTDSEALGRSMKESGDPEQVGLADDYQALAKSAQLNYNTLSRDQGARSADTGLGALQLPSSGRADIFMVRKSAFNKASLDAVEDARKKRYLDEGLKGEPSLGATPADRRAELAAQGSADEIFERLIGERTLSDDEADGIEG
ncbi:MAG: hypothetical protein M3235_18740, partial [Actinomycetota bacterium]|nr:hypothetical protein [Actinomycetota bacterium]